jgi:hypothetical protein
VRVRNRFIKQLAYFRPYSRISIGLASGFLSVNALPGLPEEVSEDRLRFPQARPPRHKFSITPKGLHVGSHSWGYASQFKKGEKIRCIYDGQNDTVNWERDGVQGESALNTPTENECIDFDCPQNTTSRFATYRGNFIQLWVWTFLVPVSKRHLVLRSQ